MISTLLLATALAMPSGLQTLIDAQDEFREAFIGEPRTRSSSYRDHIQELRMPVAHSRMFTVKGYGGWQVVVGVGGPGISISTVSVEGSTPDGVLGIDLRNEPGFKDNLEVAVRNTVKVVRDSVHWSKDELRVEYGLTDKILIIRARKHYREIPSQEEILIKIALSSSDIRHLTVWNQQFQGVDTTVSIPSNVAKDMALNSLKAINSGYVEINADDVELVGPILGTGMLNYPDILEIGSTRRDDAYANVAQTYYVGVARKVDPRHSFGSVIIDAVTGRLVSGYLLLPWEPFGELKVERFTLPPNAQ
ncbi:MAG: hypothetical protein KF812_08500 [Fimbriimonadaceae bacterium]|nr:hypothetical protein [Fimbriimonadaceae bacterium]